MTLTFIGLGKLLVIGQLNDDPFFLVFNWLTSDTPPPSRCITVTNIENTVRAVQGCSNNDGSFTTAILNSFLSPVGKIPIAADQDNLGLFSFLY